MKLGSLFSDGAVLQRNQPILVWGETLPDVLVKAEIAGREGFAKSSACGEFQLQLPPLDAGGPFNLKICSPGNKSESKTIHDILIGEVWLCSGQSNMQYCLGSNWASPREDGTEPLSRLQEKEFLETACPVNEIRFITVPMKVTGRREKYFEGTWCPMTRENAPAASAIGAWFGLKLHNVLKIPVGLICCSWGGSIVETWTSPAALRTNPDTRSQLESWEKIKREKAAWEDEAASIDGQIRKIARPDRGNHGFELGWAKPELDDSEWLDMQIPGSWITQKIAGNGAVWVRKKVIIPEKLTGKELFLKLGGIDKHDITYFNGKEIGRTGKELEICFWNQPRCYKIPGNLVRSGENIIAVRAFSFAVDGGFGGNDKSYVLTDEITEIPLSGIWKAQMEYETGRIATLPPLYGTGIHNTPGLQFQSMINPLLPFTIRGVIWYQGETNANTLENARSYQHKLETMIRDWRFHFDQPELPFIQVQLADFRSPKAYDACSAWAVLRHAQGLVCRTLPQVFMVTALDTGEEKDIHPQNKKEVGFRLAASALHHIYQKEMLPCGPILWKVRTEDNALRVFFHFSEGLELRDAPGKSFYLAGADECYSPSESGVIEGDSILLSSSKIKHPVSVRYAWSDNPNSILYNRQYPAPAFMASTKDEL